MVHQDVVHRNVVRQDHLQLQATVLVLTCRFSYGPWSLDQTRPIERQLTPLTVDLSDEPMCPDGAGLQHRLRWLEDPEQLQQEASLVWPGSTHSPPPPIATRSKKNTKIK